MTASQPVECRRTSPISMVRSGHYPWEAFAPLCGIAMQSVAIAASRVIADAIDAEVRVARPAAIVSKIFILNIPG